MLEELEEMLRESREKMTGKTVKDVGTFQGGQ